ncbi:hypothetical protein SAV14893_035960 [Streptomyces avermitilis]|uniref:Uncharacterized protein n=1 Tax=Streptomyces avermitilis TaxID=33903 RepID=A0A4D4M016_STRAX|nr:hypothetical protein SAVMC3_47970 [Streptomyces avermitilis]GDY64203.1 hypothetical protein SAV14893_035960 [Streptomyces avermitilis]GDY84614.1 hypothetical protein SAVCW2_38130 [Streptomyces avermitilis]
MCNGLSPTQVASRLKELDRIQRRLEAAGFTLCGVLFISTAGCYAAVIFSAQAANGPATTAWVAFAVLSSGISAALFKATRSAQKRRRSRKASPGGAEVPAAGTAPACAH